MDVTVPICTVEEYEDGSSSPVTRINKWFTSLATLQGLCLVRVDAAHVVQLD